jgi:3-oxoacyl-[acyl-carrier protein] reductase
MDYGLNGRVAIITGAAARPDAFAFAGQGEETARLLVNENVKVVLADINEERGNKLAEDLVSQGAKAIFVRTDVSRKEDVERLVDKALEAFGTVDILVNAAGCHAGAGKGTAGKFPHVLEEDWDLMLNTHLKGTFLCSQEVARRAMIPNRHGKIVNVSSLVAHGKYGANPYCVAKAAISWFTRGCAVTLGKYGINVNCVSPGLVLTPIWASVDLEEGKELTPEFQQMLNKDRLLDLDRVGTGRDVANAILFLVSEPASYITGVDINASAGQVLY